jgi:plasmid stabilization system protein ParE
LLNAGAAIASTHDRNVGAQANDHSPEVGCDGSSLAGFDESTGEVSFTRVAQTGPGTAPRPRCFRQSKIHFVGSSEGATPQAAEMIIEILDDALDDLADGYQFYEEQEPEIGNYFLASLYSDIEALRLYAGIHRVVYGLHRSLSKRFPFAIYYDLQDDRVRVFAVLDGRRDPAAIRKRLIGPRA